MATGNDRQRLLEVRPQFGGGAGFAGIIAGDGQPATEFRAGALEAADIVALPAVDGDGDAGQLFEGLVGIHAKRGVAFPGQTIGLFNLLGGAHSLSFSVLIEMSLRAIIVGRWRMGNIRFWQMDAQTSPTPACDGNWTMGANC